jgi:hypothetical protein
MRMEILATVCSAAGHKNFIFTAIFDRLLPVSSKKSEDIIGSFHSYLPGFQFSKLDLTRQYCSLLKI